MSDGVREQVRGLVFPGVNQLIRVSVGSSSEPGDDPVATDVASRVEDVSLGTPPSRRADPARILHVAVPSYAGDVAGIREGTWCGVAWLTPRGLYELPTRFEGRDMVGPRVRAWRLVITGPTVRAQRRRYVRVPWTAPVRLRVGGRTVTGRCVDLSEGGVRCVLPLPPLDPTAEVEVILDAQDGPLVIPAHVLRATVVKQPDGKAADTVVAFDDPEVHGDVVRRMVFTEQLRARRAGIA